MLLLLMMLMIDDVYRYVGQNRQMECLNLCMCQGLTENALVPICNNLQRFLISSVFSFDFKYWQLSADTG